MNQNLGLARPAEDADLIEDEFPVRDDERFLPDLLVIGWKFIRRKDAAGEVEASPGAPGTDFLPLTGHPGGEVLEVADGITQEWAVGAILKEPDEHRVGRRMKLEDRLVAAEVGHEGLVELENGLGRLGFTPQRLGVAEGGVVEAVAFRRGVNTGYHVPVRVRHFGKKRAWR